MDHPTKSENLGNVEDALTRQKEDLRLISESTGTKYAYQLKAHKYIVFKKLKKMKSLLKSREIKIFVL